MKINVEIKDKASNVQQCAVMPRFIPQTSEIETLMKEKLANRKIDDEFGWTGEWRMSAKDVLDVIIDLQIAYRNMQ
jgi:hypothetical protein